MQVNSYNRLLLALSALITTAGCAGLVDKHYEHTQKLRTEVAYLNFWWHCDDACGEDYKCGWKAGYLDVTTGGNGTPPMFAPPHYWKPSNAYANKEQKRLDWYQGFQDGAMLASLQPDTHYLKVWNPPAATPVAESVYHEGYDLSQPALSEPAQVPGAQDFPEIPMLNSDGTPMNDSGFNAPRTQPDTTVPPVPDRPMPIL
ncbi:hypothetical protein SH668x_002666 [Planctomicrobium sp. SH668]|uniref:hypothetical protein n=1 Tax=Planctomicrobium sp. SH668 TaxID=3448126 RepID=UPI003F5C3597